ncbi:MAG: 2-hydroxyacid dehydrogenase [Oligoflexia bacterium]|nr:2-hydroxyacid dehydrogenase [Oligoflexia bacterium]MBF0367243.1 2-hydroxyacid dehydrogenase [Oligoflexia bacterium]
MIAPKIKIAFFDSKSYEEDFFKAANTRLNFNFHIDYFKERFTIQTIKLVFSHNVICLFCNDFVNKEMIDTLCEYGVKLIALRTAGYNNVDIKAAHKKIRIVRVPEYSPHAIAEYTIALLLALNRKTHRAYYRTRDNNFSINGLMGFDLYKKTVGVIGTGRIGSVLTQLLHGFGTDIVAYDKVLNKEIVDRFAVKYLSLDELFVQADIISLNCPLTPETFHMINEESIRKMKNGVYLINTGRGKLIDTKALIAGLKSKKIAGAALDVYEEESEYFFEDFSARGIDDDILARLLTFHNVLITSHQAFFTTEAMREIAQTTLHNISDFFAGKDLKNEVHY